MNRLQHSLLKLSEECNEVAQICSKIIQFGFDSEYEGETNREKLYNELTDVLACIEYVKWHSDFEFAPSTNRILDKTDKLQKYREISEDLGYVTTDAYKL
ncbi:nucleoside triphosphate pyrophosphohydrolase [Escherichia phage EcS1]|uniref:NTP pyrophosphohydrolase MazG putative catalytic core domain-containing protein n=1 Tax=Escherichia phage EcS1 TaxID=2083276 RepID=A0A2Z5ZC93_9CAUD|nr:nucleoside triphosphate pyrophosphohydrolase [Escherichia phage EcS1]BBC78074.1 Hypothetical protein [Escherichia phage EcS1]